MTTTTTKGQKHEMTQHDGGRPCHVCSERRGFRQRWSARIEIAYFYMSGLGTLVAIPAALIALLVAPYSRGEYNVVLSCLVFLVGLLIASGAVISRLQKQRNQLLEDNIELTENYIAEMRETRRLHVAFITMYREAGVEYLKRPEHQRNSPWN